MEVPSTEMTTARRAAEASLERLTGNVGPTERARLAREHKAFVRARGVPNPDTLLLLILFYTHANVSLRLTAWFAHVAFGLTLGDESLRQRFQKAGAWLRALVLATLASTTRLAVPLRSRLRIVDGSVLCRPGATGTEWRVHVFFEPGSNVPSGVEVTDAHGAEGLNQGPLEPDTLVIGDRNYGRYREVKTAHERKVDLLARTHLQTQPLLDDGGQARAPRFWTDAADRGEIDHAVKLSHGDDPPLPARWLIVPLPPDVAGRARQKLRKAASKKGKAPNALALHLGGYLCLLTTMDKEKLRVREACSLYRIRWSIELFFKRAKSLAHLGKIRGEKDLVQVQIWARLLSVCGDEAQRPGEASERTVNVEGKGRPSTLWRWLQVLRLVWLAPLAWLAAVGARQHSTREQDQILRERSRRRGVRDLLADFPILLTVET